MSFSRLTIPRQIEAVALLGLANLLLTAGVALLIRHTLRRLQRNDHAQPLGDVPNRLF